ncbi:MAG: hypothetical protein OHK0024_23700 [Thalassobaculales bacterium]
MTDTPSRDQLAAMAARAGLTLSPERLAAVEAIYPKLMESLVRCRRGRDYALEPVTVFDPVARAR